MSNFMPATNASKFLIPIPTGWTFRDGGNECFIEKPNGEAVRFRIEPANQFHKERLNRFCTRWEVNEEATQTGTKMVRRGYRRRTDGVLEWLVNQK